MGHLFVPSVILTPFCSMPDCFMISVHTPTPLYHFPSFLFNAPQTYFIAEHILYLFEM
uniref:Uncharacterized protein n=1 Tax=Anguilla anguilla TaxID=7936 RepID=A0A0E9XLT1_ANGAN